jgi:hypothetical protein
MITVEESRALVRGTGKILGCLAPSVVDCQGCLHQLCGQLGVRVLGISTGWLDWVRPGLACSALSSISSTTLITLDGTFRVVQENSPLLAGTTFQS